MGKQLLAVEQLGSELATENAPAITAMFPDRRPRDAAERQAKQILSKAFFRLGGK